MRVLEEFRQFIRRGNVIDLAVGLIMGGAFGKVVSSLVNDLVMPPIGYLIGGVDFSDLSVVLPNVVDGQEPATIKYGSFLQTVLDFLIVSVAVFFLVKAVNLLHRREEQKPTPPPAQERLLTEIRDLLRQNLSRTEQQ